jgi:arylsulfatase A-like enzyme
MYVHRPIYVPRRFEAAAANGRYGAAVECVDWTMAVLTHELQRLGLDRNTIVMFTSDNGSRCRDEGGSNAPLRGTKGTCWEGGLRVPLIVRWNGVIPAGYACRELVTGMDFLPTLAALAGGGPPTDRIIDGKDIRPLLLDPGGAKSPHEAFFYYMMDALWAVRSGRWKLHIFFHDKPVQELYDLEADIGETTNVFDKNPDVVRRLMSMVDACRDDLGDVAVGAAGRNCRPIGRVPAGVPLTRYDPACPYVEAMYDLSDAG